MFPQSLKQFPITPGKPQGRKKGCAASARKDFTKNNQPSKAAAKLLFFLLFFGTVGVVFFRGFALFFFFSFQFFALKESICKWVSQSVLHQQPQQPLELLLSSARMILAPQKDVLQVFHLKKK